MLNDRLDMAMAKAEGAEVRDIEAEVRSIKAAFLEKQNVATCETEDS